MKAIVLRQFGGSEALRLEDLPTPKPAAGEILIKVRSVWVNRTLDCTVRAGKYPVEIHMAHVLGVDPAGDVVEVGPVGSKFNLGDRVAKISIMRFLKCNDCLRGWYGSCLAIVSKCI